MATVLEEVRVMRDRTTGCWSCKEGHDSLKVEWFVLTEVKGLSATILRILTTGNHIGQASSCSCRCVDREGVFNPYHVTCCDAYSSNPTLHLVGSEMKSAIGIRVET